jgi:hypothetical protein
MSVMTALGLRSEPEPQKVEPPKPRHKGRLIIGFNVYEWDTADPASVARVKAQFDHCLLMGMAAFETVTERSAWGPRTIEQTTRDFNPEVEQYRMTAAYAGG